MCLLSELTKNILSKLSEIFAYHNRNLYIAFHIVLDIFQPENGESGRLSLSRRDTPSSAYLERQRRGLAVVGGETKFVDLPCHRSILASIGLFRGQLLGAVSSRNDEAFSVTEDVARAVVELQCDRSLDLDSTGVPPKLVCG